jgi:hypothetical protein
MRLALGPKVLVREGAEAVYTEGPVYARVRLKNIEAKNWGVKAKVELIADLALTRPPLSDWKISAPWSVFSLEADQWRAEYLWHIFLDKELVRNLKSQELDAMPISARRIQPDRLIFAAGRKVG